MRRAALPLAVAVLVLAPAAAAQAAQRYAAPAGAGAEPCVQASPCSLKNALTKANEGDEVIVTSGSYTVSEYIYTEASNLSIHGDPGGPMPTISATVPYQAVQVSGAGSVVSYLEFIDTAEGAQALFCIGSRVERVRAIGIGKKAQGLYQGPGCTVRDSVVLASGEGATALNSVGMSGTTNVTRNVTAIAHGLESVGISAYNQELFTPGVYTLDLKNSIAQGEKFDLLAPPGLEDPSEIVVSHSNFDSVGKEGGSKVTEAGGNQTAQPLFVDAAKGDYREVAGSPTIDAGVNDQLGALDFAGNPRVLGAAPDIGAYETAGPVPPAPELSSLVLSPTTFRAANIGGAVISRKKKRNAPVGSTVIYKLSIAGAVNFSVERAVRGRRVGKRCKKVTKANRAKPKCTLYKPLKGSFSVSGNAALNSFKFSGRIENRTLKPGKYRLVGRAGTTLKRRIFHIVR
jgi:hypothetical protein